MKLEVNNIISKYPLSQYGIQAEFKYYKDKKNYLKMIGNKKRYIYFQNATHKHAGLFKSEAMDNRFTIISSIKVDLDEKDYG